MRSMTSSQPVRVNPGVMSRLVSWQLTQCAAATSRPLPAGSCGAEGAVLSPHAQTAGSSVPTTVISGVRAIQVGKQEQTTILDNSSRPTQLDTFHAAVTAGCAV